MSKYFTVTEHSNESGVFYYILVAESGYVFRDKRKPPLEDEEGNEYYEHTMAIGLMPEEYAELSEIVEVTAIADGMKVY